MNRPNISIPFTKTDSRLELVIWLLSAAILVSVIYHYAVLPERVPIHFSFNGKPDGWSGKESVWLLAGIYFFVATTLFFMNKHPQQFNYSVPITEENAAQMYQVGARMVRLIRVWVAIIFLGIQWMVYDSAMNGRASKFNYILITCVVGLLCTVGWGIYRFHIKAPK